jgi:enoyl reductase-like protein
MDKLNVVHIQNGVFSHEEWNCVLCKKIGGGRNHHLKPQSERQISCFLSYAESKPEKKKVMKVKGGLFEGWYQWKPRDK